jgi:hypothetical protein
MVIHSDRPACIAALVLGFSKCPCCNPDPEEVTQTTPDRALSPTPELGQLIGYIAT